MIKNKARAMIFVDGSNFYHGMKEAKLSPTRLDFLKLSQKLKRKIIDNIAKPLRALSATDAKR